MSAEDEGFSDVHTPMESSVMSHVAGRSAAYINVDTGKHAIANTLCGIACGISVVASVLLYQAYQDNSMELRLLQQHVMSLEAELEARKQ
jgi:hypothetical protein